MNYIKASNRQLFSVAVKSLGRELWDKRDAIECVVLLLIIGMILGASV